MNKSHLLLHGTRACLGLIALLSAPMLSGQSASGDIPEPLSFKDNATLRSVEVDWDGQIETLELSPKEIVREFVLPATVGDSYTLTFWMRAEESPLLAEKDFTDETPITLADFAPIDRQENTQRMVMRVMEGHFSVTELNDSNWRSLSGFNQQLVPGTWYFISYVRTRGLGIFYVNGDRVLKTAIPVQPHDRLQSIVFGNFDGRRAFSGDILEPRLYAQTLNDKQLKMLCQQVPVDAL